MQSGSKPTGSKLGRIAALDAARTLALVGMVIYHFNYDRELFGWSDPGTMFTMFWYWFARIVAGSFLVLAGISLWLAHGRGIRWSAFWRRFLRVAGAAALVTVATYVVFPDRYVFWGILHAIAAYSLIGLAFLRLPWLVILAAASVIAGVSYVGQAEVFNAPWTLWLGLATEGVLTVDYVPLFPWLAPFLCGIAFAKSGAINVFAPLGPLPRWMVWPGQHSLAIYLIHQPVMIAGFMAANWVGNRLF